VYWSLLDSPAYLACSYPARALYVDLRRKLSANNNGNIEAVISTLKHRGWRSSATLTRALGELQAVGLIAKTRQGGIAAMSRTCNLYRFTDEQVYEHPKLNVPACKATFDYLTFDSLGAARAAIKAARTEKKSKLQKLKLKASESEAMTPFKASESEHVGKRKLQKVKFRGNGANAPSR
jgi:hypothetical protein